MAQGAIEKYLLQKVKDRFEPAGTNKYAQRRPSGQYWSPPTNSALRSRKNRSARYNADQALVDTGELRDSIQILDRIPSGIGLVDGSGTARIGIPAGSPEYEKGTVHQFGGYTAKGGRIRPRPFLGINKSTDVRDIENLIKNNMGRFAK